MWQFVKIAFRNIVKNRTRSLILGISISVTTIILTLLMAMTSGIEDTMLRSSTTLLTGHVNIAGFHKISSSSASPVITNFKKLNQIAHENVKNTDVIIDRIKGWGKIISDTSSVQSPMWGIDINSEKGIKNVLELASKEEYIDGYVKGKETSDTEGNIEDLVNTGTIILFATHAKKLKVRVGDTVTASMPTYRNTSNTKDLRVIAVLKDIGFLSQFSIFMNKKDLRDIYQLNDDTTGQIMIYLKNINEVPRVENDLRKIISENGFRLMEKEAKPFWSKFERVAAETWTGLKIDITTWEDEISFMKWVIKTFAALSVALVLVLLFIIVLGITNAIWMSIKERTNEIGTLRSIGMQRRNIILMFILEGAILSIISTVVGLILGVLFCYILNWVQIPVSSMAFRAMILSDHMIFLVKLPNIISSFFIITVFTTSGAIIPAYKASKMKPITAINYING